jgi:secreted trypsin-like serine protease
MATAEVCDPTIIIYFYSCFDFLGAIIRDGIQVGVVSFGSDVCGDGTLPAVYVRVEDPLIRNFIRQETGV